MSGGVVVIGSINLDETLPVAAWPQPGETVLLDGPVRAGLGGKGANQAVAAALAGARVVFVGAVGDDDGGSRARAALAGHGIDVERIGAAEVATGRAVILVAPDGENLILVDPGANAELALGDVDAARTAIAAAEVVLVQGEVPVAVIDAAARVCREASTRLVLNLAPPVAVAAATLATADPLVVNESEARHLGIDVDAPERGCHRSLVVTRGAAGVLLVDGGSRHPVAALPAVVVDTTGAGDAFAGTLAARLAAGDTLLDACRRGAEAGAFAVTRPGASASYGTAAEVAAFTASVPAR